MCSPHRDHSIESAGRNSLPECAYRPAYVQKHKVKELDYNLALEKAVLEYAASVVAHPKTTTDACIRIPGYMDNHVGAMATRLNELGFITAYVRDNNSGVGVSDLSEAGTKRLKELVAQAEQIAEAKKIQMEEAIERTRKKKWWRRQLKPRQVRV